MTTPAATVGDRTLDLSTDSVQIKLRKGEILLYEQQFFSNIVYYEDGNVDESESTPIDISTWTLNAAIRDGSLATHIPMDTKKYGPKGVDTLSSYILSFDTSVLTTRVAANSERDFFFEVQANIPTGQVDSEGDEIIKTQTVLVGIATLASDIYIAPINPA